MVGFIAVELVSAHTDPPYGLICEKFNGFSCFSPHAQVLCNGLVFFQPTYPMLSTKNHYKSSVAR